jgi:hypothetical protein
MRRLGEVVQDREDQERHRGLPEQRSDPQAIAAELDAQIRADGDLRKPGVALLVELAAKKLDREDRARPPRRALIIQRGTT